MLRLKDIMTTDVAAATPGMTLREAIDMLADNQISGAPVLDGGKVVGVFSATDLLEYIGELDAAQPSVSFRGRQTPLEEVSIAEIMTRDVSSLPQDTSVTLAGAFMRQKQIHRVLVMDGARLVGIATTTDFAKAFTEHCVDAGQAPSRAPTMAKNGKSAGLILETALPIDTCCRVLE